MGACSIQGQGEIILCRNDAKPRRQSAHGSRFKVTFRKLPKGK